MLRCGKYTAQYVLAVKDNQKNLSQAIIDFFDTAVAFDFRNIDVQKHTLLEKNHGRIETRRAVFVPDVSWMDKPMREGWKKLAAVGLIESEQDIKGKVSVDRRYFIVSAGVKTVDQFAHAVRVLRPALFPTVQPKPFKVETAGVSRTARDVTRT